MGEQGWASLDGRTGMGLRVSRLSLWLRRAVEPRVARTLLSRVQWALVDQALSSGTNFAVALVVVRRVAPAEFGAFSLVVVIYVLSLGALSAVNTQPAVIGAAGSTDLLRGALGRTLGVAATAGALLGTACLLAALLIDAPISPLLATLGLCLPLLLVQDAARGLAFALGRTRRAAANDALWALATAGFLVALLTSTDPSVVALTAAWLLSGAAAGVAMAFQLGTAPSRRGLVDWVRQHAAVSRPLLGSYAFTAAPSYVMFGVAPLVSDLSQLGLARAAYLPFAAFGVVLQSAALLLLPALAGRAVADARRRSLWAAAALGLGAAVWAALVVLAVPDSVGRWLLGEQWGASATLRTLFGLALLVQAVGVPALATLSVAAPRRLLRVRASTAIVSLGCGLLLTWWTGATGLAVGILIGDLGTTAYAWWSLNAIVGSRTQPPQG